MTRAAQYLVSRHVDAKAVANIVLEREVTWHQIRANGPSSYGKLLHGWTTIRQQGHARARSHNMLLSVPLESMWDHHRVVANIQHRAHPPARVMSTCSFFLRAWLSWQEDEIRAPAAE